MGSPLPHEETPMPMRHFLLTSLVLLASLLLPGLAMAYSNCTVTGLNYVSNLENQEENYITQVVNGQPVTTVEYTGGEYVVYTVFSACGTQWRSSGTVEDAANVFNIAYTVMVPPVAININRPRAPGDSDFHQLDRYVNGSYGVSNFRRIGPMEVVPPS